jgi:hypothetical protein
MHIWRKQIMAEKNNLKNKLAAATDQQKKEQEKRALLGTIADMLERKKIDLSEIGDIKRVSLYQSIIKNDQGEAEVQDLAAIQFSPKWESGPEWPVVQQGKPVQVQKPKTKPVKKTGYKTCVVVPDIQIGYYRNMDGSLEPTHDEIAIDICLAMIRDLQPEVIACVGDNLDLPEMGKYITYPAYAQTTQASIDRATMFCAQMRDAAPHAKIVWLAGNHEERMPKYLVQNATAAYGLRKGNLGQCYQCHICAAWTNLAWNISLDTLRLISGLTRN